MWWRSGVGKGGGGQQVGGMKFKPLFPHSQIESGGGGRGRGWQEVGGEKFERPSPSSTELLHCS